MLKFILKRILLIIPTMIAIVFIVYGIMELTPGSPGRSILGMTATQEAVDRFNAEHGYDKPFLTRFVKYCTDMCKGDFGTSFRTGKPVFKEIFSRFPMTVKIAVLSITIASAIGIPLGVLSAIKQYTFIDTFTTTASLLFASIPGFWLGMMLMLLFSLKLGWLPSSGVGTWKHFVLPMMPVALGGGAGIMRLTRSMVLEAIRQDYVRTARAKGAAESTVIWVHTLRNALLPVVTSLGQSFAASLGGTVITETLFAIPGLGLLVINSIRSKDVPIVMAAVIFLAFLFCVIMLVVDVVYGLIDPRIKAKYMK